MYDNSFEKFPGLNQNSEPSSEDLNRASKWESAMENDVPAFAGDVSMGQETVPTEIPLGGVVSSPEPMGSTPGNPGEQDNKSLMDAAAIINYGLNAAAREYGVETVVQKIKGFDATGSENPIRDFFLYMGVNTPEQLKDVKLEREADRFREADFYENSDAAPMTKKRSPEGAFQAIKDMKELISEVEGADPRYEQLREEAKAAGKGYFEYAVGSKVNRGLTDLFDALAAEPKIEENPEDLPSETPLAQSEETPSEPTEETTL